MFLALALGAWPAAARGAEAANDTVQTVAADTSAVRVAPRLPWHEQPGWVGARSLVLPAWGQVANRQWLKALLVGGGELMVIARVVDDERDLKQLSRDIDAAHLSGNTETEDALIETYNLRLVTQNQHRWWLGGLLLVSMVDAYVDAHFRGFEVNFDDDPALGDEAPPARRVSVGYRWTF